VPDDPWVVALPFDGWLLVGNAGEVAQVLTCLLKGGRTVICAYALVAGHDDARLERLDGVVGGDPLLARAGVGFGDHHVHLVVDDVSGHHRIDRGNVKDG
jgi:hypothetical protein